MRDDLLNQDSNTAIIALMKCTSHSDEDVLNILKIADEISPWGKPSLVIE